VLNSNYFRLGTRAPLHIGNKQTQENISVPFFVGTIRALTELFNSKLTDEVSRCFGNPADSRSSSIYNCRLTVKPRTTDFKRPVEGPV